METEVINPLLVKKYDRPLPRYTSYPTVPFWNDTPDPAQWASVFRKKFNEENHINGICLYVHLPFCESLCTYCGCNKKITANHKVEEEYLSVLEKEWTLYKNLMMQTPVIREIHFGGGTPTFFSPTNLQRLLSFILKGSIVHPAHEFSIEGHPNNTTEEHLNTLFASGFRRISYGVQDNDPRVQHIINRIQPFENVRAATERARASGFVSVNFDLIYGLPMQTRESIERTFLQVIELKPDRIAFYSYAHVPWTARSQRLYNESDLPGSSEKIQLYLKGRELLMKNGYTDIGMDHFALPSDNLYKTWKQGKLHRNFMGYTTRYPGLLLGLGASAISDTGNAFAQNQKSLHEYYYSVNAGRLAIMKGYFLSPLDISFRKYIADIACKGATQFNGEYTDIFEHHVFPKLAELEKDGLVIWNREGVQLTGQGHYFIRNICSAFDLYLDQTGSQRQIFSKAV